MTRIGQALRRLKSKLFYLRWKCRTYRTASVAAKLYDVGKTYWIDPGRIIRSVDSPPLDRRVASPPVNPLLERGRIVGGDWDLKCGPVEEMLCWQAFQDRFVHHRSWQETAWYSRILRDIRAKMVLWGCTTQEELDARFQMIDRLFDEIKNKGYRAQSEIRDGACKPYGDEDEIYVHIGRNGDYTFANGRHRLCIARILKLDRVPVKVAKRHVHWVNFRKEILACAKAAAHGKVYAPLPHPDLADIPSHHGHERMEMMANRVSASRGALLDLGANWGYFCHRFADLGFQCTAVEVDPVHLYFMRKLMRAEHKSFEIIDRSILDLETARKFDVVLALNIFHHFLKKQDLHERLIRFLSRLEAGTMFFEPHLPGEPQMAGSFRNYGPEEFAEFIKEHGRFGSSEQIGVALDGRSLFMLRR